LQVPQVGRFKITKTKQQVHRPSLCQVTVSHMPRYIIVGAGAVGGALGGRLGLVGRNVVLAARGDNLAALRDRGLRLRTPDEDVTLSLQAIGRPEEIKLDIDDVLFLATKVHQANEALVTWTDVPVRR